jgi:hypothetical protein
LATLPVWLQRWNFIERARLERQLWEAFERGEPIEQLVESCAPGFQKEVWASTAVRIRRIERLMANRKPPEG